MAEPTDSSSVDVMEIKLAVTFSQRGDDAQEGQTDQELRISTEDAGAGPYMVLRTERWAIDTNRELGRLVDQVEMAMHVVFSAFGRLGDSDG